MVLETTNSIDDEVAERDTARYGPKSVSAVGVAEIARKISLLHAVYHPAEDLEDL